MIYGNIYGMFFEEQVSVLPEVLGAALRQLKGMDLAALPAGQSSITISGIPMILQVHDIQTKAREACLPEIHRKFVDLQMFVSGSTERDGFYIEEGNGVVNSDELAGPRDILFYENDPKAEESCVLMKPGAYAVFFPWDVHIPGQAPAEPGNFRKIVLKVPFEACLGK